MRSTGLKGRSLRLISVLLFSGLLFGCASVKLPSPTASADIVQQLRGEKLSPAKTGTFSVAAGKPADMDSKVGGLRGSSLAAESGSFSRYLKEEIVTELKAAGIYDESSTLSIDGYLTDSQLDAAISKGTGRLAARFIVTNSGKQLYDREVAVDATWDSSFIGAVALPEAVNQYSALYKTLVKKLFDDPDFRLALTK